MEKLKYHTRYEETTKLSELKKMKLLAASLLLLAFVIFVIASIFEKQYAWVSFIRATAEAAMVGAIADWFAVTALFRHPLNLKIPHTAIIPNRKDMIGQSLGRFVKNNFLSEEVVADRLRSLDISKQVAEWLSRPENSELITHHAVIGLAALVQVMRDEDIQQLIEYNLATRIRSTQIAPLLGKVLGLVISGNRQQELLHGTIRLAAHLLAENRNQIKKKISQELPWWIPKSVDSAIYQRIVDAVDKTLQEVSADPNHPIQQKFNEVVTHFVEDLQHSPEVISREEMWKEELLQHSVVRDFSSSFWTDLKTSLMEYSSNPDLEVRKSIQQGLSRLGETIRQDDALLEKINHWMEEGILYFIKEYGHEVEHLIAYTISKWDAEATSRKIELQVGKDLQFIRINGTLVGGLVGLIIHTLAFLLQRI